MTLQLNTQVFSYTKQFAEGAFKAQAVALRSLQSVAELQLAAWEKQSHATSQFLSDVFETRDFDGVRTLWEKGANLGRQNAERAVAVTQEIFAVTQKAAESLGALAQEQQQAANDAVSAPIAAAKKDAAVGK